MRDLREVQLEAFRDELQKQGSKWYAEAGKDVANFAKRQTHAITGWTPHGMPRAAGLESIGGGAADARKRLENLRGKVVSHAEYGRAKASLAANERAQDMGLTSIPGFASSLISKPKETLQAGFNQQWHGTGPVGKTFMVGLPAGLTALSAAQSDDPDNPHKGRELGAGIASTAAGMVTGGIPLASGMLLSEGVSRAGGAAGGVVDRLRKRRRQPPTMGTVQPPRAPEEAVGQHVATERVLSPAAAGQLPEGYA